MQKVNWRQILARAAGSTFLLTALLLIVFDVVLNYVKPLRLANTTGFTTIRQNHLVSKLPQIMESPENRDVLLIGSSTMLVPAVRCDDEMHGRRTRYDSWYKRNVLNEYYRCDYLEKLLSDGLRKPVTVWNASISASVMSDQYLIVRKYLSTGRRPKLVILSVAPREFLDNVRKNVEKTATYSLLADFTSLPELLNSTRDPWRVADALLGVGWSYYKSRGDYRNFFDSAMSKTTGHPVNMHQATLVQHGEKLFNDKEAVRELMNAEDIEYAVFEQVKPVYEPKPNTLRDLGSYQEMYLPINDTQFATQSDYFKKLLTLLKEQNIATVVVDVPLVSENYKLLPPTVLKRYRTLLADDCRKFGATLVTPGRWSEAAMGTSSASPITQASFALNDYEDTVHMTASGGKKMFQAIADAICKNAELVREISPTSRNVASSGPGL